MQALGVGVTLDHAGECLGTGPEGLHRNTQAGKLCPVRLEHCTLQEGGYQACVCCALNCQLFSLA